MSGRWKKAIWALLMLQMCLLHVYLLYRINYSASYYWYRGCVRLGLPYFLYDKGFHLVALGVSSVSALMVLIFFIHYRSFRCKCISGIYPLEEEGIRHQYEEACIRAGIAGTGRKLIYASPKVATPFVLGFYKPVILLPEWTREEKMLAMLLAHECVHIRHRDTWYKFFLFLCNALCWYNPLAYLIRSISYRDIEIDCDEAVVAGYSMEEREAYGQFLIDSLKRVQTREYAYSAFFSAGGRMMKARIAAVMENKRPYNVLAGGIVALLILETALALSIGGRRFMENRRAEAVPAEEDSYRQDAWNMPYRDIEDYSDVPYFTGKPKAETELEYEARTSGGILEMRKIGQEEWETVPVSLEELFKRGDGMDGELTRLQDGSYQCDGIKQIFAYGGCGSYGGIQGLPVCVVYYDKEAGAFRSSVVTEDYGSVRRLFVSFPENDRKGYLVLTSDRTMWHECTACFVTEDGGKSWKECKIEEGGELMEHSLTMDMKFITNDIGFITIRSSGSPDVIRTKDGGITWETVTFDEPKEYYSIAYAPFFENGKWTMDVGEEEYGKNDGIKARYVTEDMGKTWQFTDFVVK